MSKRIRTTRRLEVWLKDTSVALFVLNSQRRLVFFNVGCETLTGWSPADLLGQVCQYLSEPTADPAALLACLAPPASVWNGSAVTVPMPVVRKEQERLPCVIHYYPLTDLEQKVQATLGIIQPTALPDPERADSLSSRLHAELAALRSTLAQQYSERSLIARSAAMRRVVAQVALARQSRLPVLLVGEPGSGREQLARLLHQARDTERRLFVPLDCARLPADQLESTLERVSQVHKDDPLRPGTIYLEQVDELPRDLQRRVLEMMKPNQSGLDFLASTTRALEPLVESGEFLEELLFALTPLTIVVPPLRHRPQDLEPLAQYFLEELNRGTARQVDGFQPQVWEQFQRYDWPGNVRELKAVVTEARQAATGTLIETSDLPFRFRAGIDRQSIGPATRPRAVPLDPLLLSVEREQIELALAEAKRNKAKAAELLGITRPRLYRRMEILGIIDDDPTPNDEVATMPE